MRPVDAPSQPSAAISVPLDLAAVVIALALAWLMRDATDLMALWGTLWTPAGWWLVATQVTMVTLATRMRAHGVALALGGALVAGGALGWAISLSQGTPLPRGLVIGHVWLALLVTSAWRSAWWLQQRSRTRAADGESDAMVAPGRSPSPLAVLRRHHTLLHLLVARDLKLKYRGSVVGFFWSLANPIVMTGTYTLAFTYIFPNRTEGFVFLLLIGILAWTFFSASAGMATGAIVDSGSLVRSIYFPRVILPLATVLFNFIQYLLALGVLLPFMFAFYRIRPDWPVLLLPLVLALVFVFTLGVSLIMAATTAAYRDVRHLLDITLQVLFWATPILYSRTTFPEAGGLIALSPLAPFIDIARTLTYAGAWPSSSLWLLAVVYATCALLIGLSVFLRHEERFAE